jgi:ankyrin repeat protein
MATQEEQVNAELLRMDALVAAGADPFTDFGRFRGTSPSAMAHLACEADCSHVLSICLDEYGMGVNEVLSDGHTLLTLTSLCSSCKCVAVLLSRGANANKLGGTDRMSPLYYATTQGSIIICRQLLNAGAALDFRCSAHKHRTPLHAAAVNGNVGIVALLLNRGADARATDDNLTTPIIHGIANRHRSMSRSMLVVKALLPHSNLTQLDCNGLSLLHIAVIVGDVALLKLVLPRYVEGGLVDIPSGAVAGHPDELFGLTPLMFAVKNGKYDEEKVLLRAGASRNILDSHGGSALHSCISGTSAACLELLLGDAPQWHYTPSELNALKVNGCNALHLAVAGGSVEQSKLLIAAGADPGISTAGGFSPLALALGFWQERSELVALFAPGGVFEPQLPRCSKCHRSDVKLSACSNCHTARYCSKACQRAHWPQHKDACVHHDDVREALKSRFRSYIAP